VVSHSQALPVECWLVRISGRVQGVGYREACIRQADLLGVTGWVRNRRDGTVEATLQGRADQLARMREWLSHGPVAASVDQVQVTRLEVPFPRFDRFDLQPTA
jgi:acylphosphatase